MEQNSRNLKVGIVGCGNIARIAWAPNFQEAGVEMLHFDVDPQNARRLAAEFGGVPCDTLEGLLEQQPDGVVVATWAPTHYDVAARVLSHRIPVLVEKPLTTTLADAKALVEMAHDLGRPIAQPYHQLLMVQPLLERVQRGEIGELSAIEYVWERAAPGSGLLEDLGPHAIALVLALCDFERIAMVSAHEFDGTHLVKLHHEEGVDITIRIGSGVEMPVDERIALVLTGSTGSIEANLRTTLTPSEEEFDYRPALYIPDGGRRARLQRLPLVPRVDDVRAIQALTWLESLGGGPALPEFRTA